MTTRSAAEALEKLIRLERNLEKKCHDLGYYNMIHVGLREFVEHAETFRAALAPPQEGEPTITVSGPVACGKSFVMELIYKALRDAGLHPYSDDLAHERRMVDGQPPPPTKVWKLREAVYAAPPPPAPAQEPVDVAASSIRNGSTNKGDKMINYTGRHKDSFDRFFASTQKEKPVGWRKDLNPPHGNFTLQWLEENPWPEQNHVQPLYAAPPPDEARELLAHLVAIVPEPELVYSLDEPPAHRTMEEHELGYALHLARAYLEKHK